MPVDGRLRSRRPITGRALGTVGLQAGSIHRIIEDLQGIGESTNGVITKKIPILIKPDTPVIDTSIL